MNPAPPAPLLDRRTFIGAMILAQLAPHWQCRSANEAEARARLALTALDIADTYLRLADAPPLGVPCPRQPKLDPPF